MTTEQDSTTETDSTTRAEFIAMIAELYAVPTTLIRYESLTRAMVGRIPIVHN